MDFWEQAVQRYLARDRATFLSPQYLVGEAGEWDAYPDFLAIQFAQRKIWFVEVTTYPRKALLQKLDNFVPNYSTRIFKQLEDDRVLIGESRQLGIWIFAQEAARSKIEKYRAKLTLEGVDLAFTSLKETLFPEDYLSE